MRFTRRHNGIRQRVIQIRTGSIYIIRNRVNDKVYIGQTTMDIKERFYAHIKPSTSKRRSTYKLYNAIAKYGAENFYVEMLEDNIPIEKLDELEIDYIAKFDSFHNGYNSTPGGDGRVINKVNNEDELLALAKSGVSAKELATRYNVHKATIYRTLHKLGFYYNYIDNDYIIEQAMLGRTDAEMAEELGCHKVTIERALHKNGIRRRRQRIDRRDEFDYDGLFKDYSNQMPIGEICKKYDISKTTFSRIRHKHQIEKRPQIYASKGCDSLQ